MAWMPSVPAANNYCYLGNALVVALCFSLAACGGGGAGGGSAGGSGSGSGSGSATGAGTPSSNANVSSQSTTQSTGSASQVGQTTASVDPMSNLKVIAFYTPGFSDRYAEGSELRIEHLVDVANDAYETSGVSARLELVGSFPVNYSDTTDSRAALDALTFADDPALAQVPVLRNQLAADLVVLVRRFSGTDVCGVAWVGGTGTNGDFSGPTEADFAYSVVAGNCQASVLAHELGHNMGLVHSRSETPAGGSLAHGSGYAIDTQFATIMAPAEDFNATGLLRFSSPDAMCWGVPCGVAAADPVQGADAVSALNSVVEQIARYRAD